MKYKRIGIIGGLAPSSTIDYYNNLLKLHYERCNNFSFPEIFIYSLDFQRVIKEDYKCSSYLKEIDKYMKESGVDFMIAACNSIHVIHDALKSEMSVEWIPIMDAVSKRLKEDDRKKTLVLGTDYTINARLYNRYLEERNIEAVLLDSKKQSAINKIIYNELVFGDVSNVSKTVFRGIIKEAMDKGIDSVLLGCTELNYLAKNMSELENMFYDSALLHVKYAYNYATN